MPFNIQPSDLIGIAIIALLIFGPSRLPEIGRSLGKTINEFRSATKEAAQGLSQEITKPTQEPKEENRPNCKNCSKPLQTGAKFCGECGTAQ